MEGATMAKDKGIPYVGVSYNTRWYSPPNVRRWLRKQEDSLIIKK
jgi:hypothetical protein